jgi:hypothetical protein
MFTMFLFQQRSAPMPVGPHPTMSDWRMAHWMVLFAVLAAAALLLMRPHWGLTVEDSLAYFDTARYLRGEAAFSELRAPFPYRLLMPALAAYLPGDLRNTFALLNWVSVSVAAAGMCTIVARVGGSRQQVIGAGLLLVLSVPTFWYASYLLTDPGALAARTLFVLGVISGQPWLAVGAALTATAIREENILLLAWLLVFRRVSIPVGVATIAAAACWLLLVRWWLLPGLPAYLWVPSIEMLWRALHDMRSLLSVIGAAVVVVPLALLGWKHSPPSLSPLKSMLLLMALPLGYAALSVRIDGRAIWSLYPFLIPLAVYARLPGGARAR